MDYLYFGTITGTHGIKGELKVITDFEKKEKVLKIGFSIYIEQEKYTITSCRTHQNKELITINSWNDINEVLKFHGKDIYILRDDLNLGQEFLMMDLVGYKIIENNEILGIVGQIRTNKAGYLLQIAGEKTFFIPYQDYFIKKVLPEEKTIIVRHGKELML